jgi:hypothetical protein
VRIGKRLFYTYTDVRYIASTIERYSSPHVARREAGYLSKGEIVEKVGFSITAIKWWIGKGVIPEPTHVFAGCQDAYYNKAEAKQIIQFFSKRRGSYQKWLSGKRVFGWQREKRIA